MARAREAAPTGNSIYASNTNTVDPTIIGAGNVLNAGSGSMAANPYVSGGPNAEQVSIQVAVHSLPANLDFLKANLFAVSCRERLPGTFPWNWPARMPRH